MKKEKRAYKNGAVKLMKVPHRFKPGFLKKMDERTMIFANLKISYDSVVDDLGGIENISFIKKSLIERYVFLLNALRDIEQQIVFDETKSAELLGRWTQSLNAFLGLSKTLGLTRRAKMIESLSTYVLSKKEKNG